MMGHGYGSIQKNRENISILSISPVRLQSGLSFGSSSLSVYRIVCDYVLCNHFTTLLLCRDDLRHYLPPSKPVLAHQLCPQLQIPRHYCFYCTGKATCGGPEGSRIPVRRTFILLLGHLRPTSINCIYTITFEFVKI